MTIPGHKPFLRGSSCVCANCGLFLYDVRTGARLRALTDADPVKLAAVERRFSFDPELAKRLATEDPHEVVATYKLADKLNDFLRNPQSRPDLQTPDAQQFLDVLDRYHSPKTDPMMPWLTREWKKGRVKLHPLGGNIMFDGGPEYAHPNPEDPSKEITHHALTQPELEHWADWYNSDHPSRKGKDIMQMQTPEMHETIKNWDTDMRNKAGDAAQVRGNIEHSFPDGWSVQKLETQKALEDEGNSMGHCVGSYFPAVQRGETQIYSLRDHQNEPHATWELTPRWHEGTDGKLYSNPDGTDENSTDGFTTIPSPKDAIIEQIQGKANERPNPTYQKRIKDYMETKFPDPKDRPKWEDQHHGDLDEWMDEEGQNGYVSYHPGEYGLAQPPTEYNWPHMTEQAAGWWHYEPQDIMRKAVEEGQFEPFATAMERTIENNRQKAKKEDEYSWDHYGAAGEWARSHEESHPEPSYEAYPPEKQDEYNAHWEQWDKEREAAEQRAKEEFLKQQSEMSQEEEFHQNMEVEIAAQKMRQRQAVEEEIKGQVAQKPELPMLAREREREEQGEPRVAKINRGIHTNYSTGEPCNCTFNRVAPEWHQAALPVCDVCGDPLDHGQCKRCDWGGWSNAMGDGDQNPIDPTRDAHPGIQASRQGWQEG